MRTTILFAMILGLVFLFGCNGPDDHTPETPEPRAPDTTPQSSQT